MAGVAGGFVTRSFESILKECSGKKYPALQKAIQAYLDCTKGVSPWPDSQDLKSANSGGESFGTAVQTRMHVSTALASAGSTLEGAQADLLLQPLRLAFETKNIKLVEGALDCLHKLIAYEHLEGDPGINGGKNDPLFSNILTTVCGCIDASSSDSTTIQVLKVLLTAVASTKFRVHGEPLLAVIRVCYNISLNSKSPVNQVTSKAMLTQMISIVFRRMESDEVSLSSIGSAEQTTAAQSDTVANNSNKLEVQQEEPSISLEELQNLAGAADIKALEAVLYRDVSLEDDKSVSWGVDLERMNIGHRDAILVFRNLCKMAMQEETDDITTKKRLLSLELLQGLLEGASHCLATDHHFIDSIKGYLCYTLLRASVSSSLTIFQSATGIFAALLLRFRQSLKREISIFFHLIILRSLDLSDSHAGQKIQVLRTLEKLCKDPQMLADIFVNYDCDPEAGKVFERMVNSLSRIAQGLQHGEPNSATVAHVTLVKSSSLQCLVNVLKSLAEWRKAQRQTMEYSSSRPSRADKSIEQSTSMPETKSIDYSFNKFGEHDAQISTVDASIFEFNKKPGKGMELLISNKLVDKTAASVANFLRNTPGLDKAAIGEYLGQPEEFPVAVMHAYVDSMEFSGLKFDVAIREFFQGLQLPGEAQKIDRIIEKFAECYYANNPELMRNADTAYVLAYAVIMLNIDVHDPLVWPKMSKSDFVKMISLCVGEECAPEELLNEIYDAVSMEEIKIKVDDRTLGESNGKSPEERERRRLVSILNLSFPQRNPDSDTKFKSEEIIKKMQTLIQEEKVERGVLVANHVELVLPMLEAVGWPLLAAFSVVMEEGDNMGRILLCMEGLKTCIHLTWILGVDTMRFAFLTSLVRFTFLHSPKEMRIKNVEALRTLLSLGDIELDSLQNTWNAVLECISRLEYIISTPAVSANMMHGSNQLSKDSVLQSLRELAGKPIEQVFLNSVKLRSESVVEFFTALCCVSAEELKQNPARIFSLQKLVEISYYNMARVRLVWARIWSVLARHFVVAGSHHDEEIAMYAINSLRQLGMKYLERPELTNFTFQNDIMKPFVILMQNVQDQSLRGLIVDCIVQMIKSNVGSIKTGWRSVFIIFTSAAADDLELIIESAFENVEQVILEHFDQVVCDCFMDCVNCLIRFANNKSSSRISLKAIALLRICENHLAEGFVPGGALKFEAGKNANQDVTEHYWLPMLAGLSDLTFDPRLEVRNCALEVLFDFLNERGSKFSSEFWKNTFHRVLFPIFDHIRQAGRDGTISSADACLRDSIVHSLQLLCNLFSTFYKEVSFMLPPLLNLLVDCAKKSDQSVVSISLGALVHLIDVGGYKFKDDDWDALIESLRDASCATQPSELLNSLGLAWSKDPVTPAGDLDGKRSGSSTIIALPSNADGNRKTTIQLPLTDNTENPGKDANARSYDNFDISEGNVKKFPGSENVGKSQTFGVRMMGNMMDSILLRRLASKTQPEDVPLPSSPLKDFDAVEHNPKGEHERNLLSESVRVKCVTQLLLLGALDCIQKKFWTRLKHSQKMAIIDILVSVLDFAASYNSHNNLRQRVHLTHSERPPLNLLRQEMAGTSIYLDILQKSTWGYGSGSENSVIVDNTVNSSINESRTDKIPDADEVLKDIAEKKLVLFCGQVLKEACVLQQSGIGSETVEVHQVFELRAPIIVKVLKGMSLMNNHLFKRHLGEFYPLITKLICCEQMDVRGALADLFSMQLPSLLP